MKTRTWVTLCVLRRLRLVAWPWETAVYSYVVWAGLLIWLCVRRDHPRHLIRHLLWPAKTQAVSQEVHPPTGDPCAQREATFPLCVPESRRAGYNPCLPALADCTELTPHRFYTRPSWQTARTRPWRLSSREPHPTWALDACQTLSGCETCWEEKRGRARAWQWPHPQQPKPCTPLAPAQALGRGLPLNRLPRWDNLKLNTRRCNARYAIGAGCDNRPCAGCRVTVNLHKRTAQHLRNHDLALVMHGAEIVS